MRRDRLLEDESAAGSKNKVGAVIREDDGHCDGVRTLRRRVHVARPAFVVAVVVAVERQDCAIHARDAVAAVVVAALAIGRMDLGYIR